MKLVIIAGPPTCGKTTVIKQVIKKMIGADIRPAFLKVDVQYIDEDEMIKKEFGIPVKKVYSGELCPDHCNVLILADAVKWAEKSGANLLFVETAGLCLRCSPYVEGSLGISVLESTSGMNLPRKIGPMLSLADIAVVTKIDLISQAEREVFRARINEVSPNVEIIESNALYGIGIDPLIKKIKESKEAVLPMFLRGNPPVGTCTICAGKKEIGTEHHYGVLRTLDEDLFYRGE
ncbi:MAG: GTP-binding protein [Patescibacteria group bacterium]|nr:GTP-binding protein [Patescibacteria group bacterium]